MKCTECKRCNHKGKPSVTKNSKVCHERMKIKSKTGIIKQFTNNLLNRFKNIKEDGETVQMPVKGFRMSILKRMK